MREQLTTQHGMTDADARAAAADRRGDALCGLSARVAVLTGDDGVPVAASHRGHRPGTTAPECKACQKRMQLIEIGRD